MNTVHVSVCVRACMLYVRKQSTLAAVSAEYSHIWVASVARVAADVFTLVACRFRRVLVDMEAVVCQIASSAVDSAWSERE